MIRLRHLTVTHIYFSIPSATPTILYWFHYTVYPFFFPLSANNFLTGNVVPNTNFIRHFLYVFYNLVGASRKSFFDFLVMSLIMGENIREYLRDYDFCYLMFFTFQNVFFKKLFIVT